MKTTINNHDHLGNARAGFLVKSDGTVDRSFRSDYYPFGKVYNGSYPSPKNNYLYNGKELQEELEQYDYGARFYDPVIERWGSEDPLSEDFDDVSLYNYAMNNPISFIDPTGMSAEDSTSKYGHQSQPVQTPKSVNNSGVEVATALPVAYNIALGAVVMLM